MAHLLLVPRVHPRLVLPAIVAVALVVLLAMPSAAQEEDTPERTEVWEPEPDVVDPGPGGAAPSDAIVLFDGTDLAAWDSAGGGDSSWRIEDGAMVAVAGAGDIVTRQGFGDVQLHVEWRTPAEVVGDGQGRGNSGVFLMARYEVQVLDSFDNRTYANGQAASIYKQHIPLVNASRGPGEWQTYDIVFRAPEFAADGRVEVPAVLTVLHNGVLVQDHVVLRGSTVWVGDPSYEAHGAREPIVLQDHGNPVSYRNIWVRELAPQSEEPAAGKRMAIERLYSLPSIIGTTPSGATWSPDSKRVAFLWNSRGWPFREVWVAGTTTGASSKLVTDFERSGERMDPGTDVDALRVQARADLDGGVASVIWYPDSEKLLAVRSGEFYRVDPLGAPNGVMGTAVVALNLRGSRPAFSPTGSYLAFVRQGDVWLAPIADDEIGEAERLTSIAGSGRGVMRYSWSPDGGSLAVQTRDGSGVAAVLIPDYLGEATTVNEVPRPFPGDEPGRTHLSVISTTAGAPVALTVSDDDRDSIFSFKWSADSTRLLVDTSDLYVKDRRVLSVDAATGAATTLYREQEPDNVMAYWSVDWAPDGGIYFISDRDDFYHLYHLAAGEAEPVAMTAGEWAVERFATTPGGLFVVANTPHASERQIFKVQGPGAGPLRLSGESGTHSPTYSPDGRWAAVIFSSDAQPPELYLNSLDGEDEIRITNSTEFSDFDEYEWVTPEYVTFASHVDGVEIHGRLLLPPDFNPARQYPAIIGSIYSGALRNQWGGRNAHPVWGLDQILLQRGYVVLNIDIRGSWGHGRAFRRKLKRDYGGVDTEDIYSGVQYLIASGYVDAERIGLWGSSYGGLMTAMSLFTRPGVFAAGVAGAPATNVWHALTGEMRVMGRPQDDPGAYADSSAFTHAAGLEDPLMIIHGMRDRVVLFKDSVQLMENLMLLGKGHLLELVALPNSPHGWDARELYQTRYAFRKLVDHFDRYLEPGSDR